VFVFSNTANTYEENLLHASETQTEGPENGGAEKHLNPISFIFLSLFYAGTLFAHFLVSMNSFNILAKFLKVHINMFDV